MSGFQDTWGPHRQSEWVLKEITGKSKQRKYAAVLCSMWVEQSKGILVDRTSDRVISFDTTAKATNKTTSQSKVASESKLED